MAYSHYTETGSVQVQVMEPGAMGTNILHKNVHTGPKQGKEPGFIVFFCAGPVSCTCPGPIPVECEQAIPVLFAFKQ